MQVRSLRKERIHAQAESGSPPERRFRTTASSAGRPKLASAGMQPQQHAVHLGKMRQPRGDDTFDSGHGIDLGIDVAPGTISGIDVFASPFPPPPPPSSSLLAKLAFVALVVVAFSAVAFVAATVFFVVIVVGWLGLPRYVLAHSRGCRLHRA
uniref:FGENESH: predicted gene_15.203 protein n=1 Tax=Rhodotorula toruloides TaxID=5286 RepID=A0A0K3CUU7_RHOTO